MQRRHLLQWTLLFTLISAIGAEVLAQPADDAQELPPTDAMAWAFGTNPDPIISPNAKLEKLLTHCSTNTKIYSTKRKFAIWAKKLTPGKENFFRLNLFL